ncbi:thiamine-monophosphate kinase [Zafaria cholistanensis]|uniref:Thiamine-monophosphate kinase n=1 Tax=Zafaria cholistanensis TaxID=1682741 RepID=A0A5A7NMA6_9MICC|nr:thiamine-phosphate kinase [Zafaria cholistanensis]GER21900.1 thiamine-monophosphate kinase [Zafaria cholistanensis]
MAEVRPAAEGPTVAGLGEAGLLARILPRLAGAPALLGPGDDAAVVAAPDGRFVVSVDTLVQDQDFRLEWPNGYRTTGFDVGWKSAAQNLSDINAMGAVATALVISLTLPARTPVAWVESLADGYSAAVRTLGADRCALAGGDLGAGSELAVTAAATGSLEGRAAVVRSGARPGDTLAVCGVLGAAAAGLALLESPLPYARLGEAERALVARQARPLPPLAAGPQAALAGARAMLDLSDGLVRDAGRMAAASGVAIDLEAAALEGDAGALAAAGAATGVPPLLWVLSGGEDHGLLAAFPPGAPLPHGFRRIGTVLEAGGLEPGGLGSGRLPAPVCVDGRPAAEALARLRGQRPGYDHFGG